MKMNKGRIFTLLLTAASMTIFVSCGSGSGGKKKGGGTKNFTSTSGFKQNDQRGWFFNGNKTKPNVKPWQNMVFIEGGTFTMGLVKDDVMHDWNNTPRRMQVSSFFIGETEVTNYEYREYLTWLSGFPDRRSCL